jgi:hypothetical protein
MKLAIGVMAHISRVEAANALLAKIAGDLMVIDHGEPSVAGENANGNLAWRGLSGSGAEWAIVLQDDALPIEGFREYAEQALKLAPETAVSFYVGTGRPLAAQVSHTLQLADQHGATWLEADELYWGVAVAMPVTELPGYLDWSDRITHLRYDSRIGNWFHRSGRPIRYTWPSLVDHADGQTLAHRAMPDFERRAHRLGVPPDGYEGPVQSMTHLGARRL